MKPLRAAWTAHTIPSLPNHKKADRIVSWLGHLVVPHVGGKTVGVLYKPDGTFVRTIPAPDPTTLRVPASAVVVWPEEALVIGLVTDTTLDLAWIDLVGSPSLNHCATVPGDPARLELTSTADGAVLVSSSIREVQRAPDELWKIDRALDPMFKDVLRWPFEPLEFVTSCFTRAGDRRWCEVGRTACVADDVVVLQDTHDIVARRATDGVELWRRHARDRFVLGTVAMPAWSDDRVFVLDRHERRREAWAREADVARIHGVNAESPFRTLAATRLLAETKRTRPLTTPSVLSCVSTRTGDELWHTEIDGDIVSFFAHPKWVACVVAGEQLAVRAWRPDGVARASVAIRRDRGSDAAWWPVVASACPCVVAGDDEHVVMIENHGNDSLVTCLRFGRAEPAWQARIPFKCVVDPYGRLRTTNRATVAFVGDAAVARHGRELQGLLP